jgi:6-phosphogluconate dehydrogenase
MPAISSALTARFVSRQDDLPAMKLVAALRRAFRGHAVTEALDPGQDETGEPSD